MKKYNDKKICFIICTNDEQQLNECLLYLHLLQVPDGYETEILTIMDAKSMTSGYNEGMNASDAKYKVYMHQDTFIVEKLFIQKMLDVFQQNDQIGALGIVGAEKLSKDGVMWHEQRCGNFYRLDELRAAGFHNIEAVEGDFQEVEVVDGLLIATQYDIPWREDIFKGWDFYDVSQCLEFRRAGYKVVVPKQESNWVIHACGAPSFWYYNENRKIALKEYPEIYKDKAYLRILFVHSNEISIMGCPYSLTEMGHTIHIPTYKVSLCQCREDEVRLLEEELEEGHYDLVMTYDFCPSISVACENSKVKYYAWVYDSPLLELYRTEAQNQWSYISVFDKKQYERLQELQRIPHLFYLPLATEVNVFGGVNITKEDEKKYKADVAFVGRLYDKRGFEQIFDEASTTMREQAEEIVSGCNCLWDGQNHLFDKASEELIQYMISKESESTWDVYHMDKRYYCESMRLARRCNEIERVTILNKLAEKHDVVLYTDKESNDMLKNVKMRPWVDYWAEMPKVFYLSKINLNITSRSIESAIPQRVWDIMAVGGFVLTNYQPEIEDYFEIGKDLEVYHNLDELQEKVEYYLKHEKKRIQIAINGYKKVREKHNYMVRLEQALKFIEKEQ